MSEQKRGFNRASGVALLLAFFTLALVSNLNAQAPSSIDGKTLMITITTGVPPKLASSGKLALALLDTGNSYRIYGLTANISDESGAFNYVKNSETNGTLTLTQDTNVFTVNLKFTTAAGGTYRLTEVGVTGAQSGTFQVFNGPAPIDVSNRIYDLTAASGVAPFAATGHFRMYLQGDGNYLLKNMATGQSSNGIYTNNPATASTVSLDMSNSIFGNGSALFVFSNSVSGAYLLDNHTGFQVGKFHEVLPPVITQSPSNTSVILGKSVTFTARATGDGPLRFQWYFNGNSVPGATNAVLTVLNVKSTNAGAFYVAVTNDAGPTTSGEFTLSIIFPPTIVTQPIGQTNPIGSTAVFTVVANGTNPLRYQWQFNGINLTGKTTSSLTITNLKAANSGSYRALVRNAAATVPSASARLLVLAPIKITATPRGYLANTNASVLLSVTATGSAPLRYQWQWNGSNIVGATTPQFIVRGLSATNAGNYSVNLSNRVSSTNLSAVVSVTAAPFDPNHDGQTDLLIQADDGHLITWFLSGTSFLKNIALNPNPVIDPAWRVAGLSDFNNDGQKDILFQNTNSGALVVWFMNGTNFIGTANIDSGGAIDANWKVSSVADMDGNGAGDLIAQNALDNSIAVWLMNGTNFVNTNPITICSINGLRYDPIATTNWGFGKLKLIGIGNFHSPGFPRSPDILTQGEDGFPIAWLMNGTNFPIVDTGTNLISREPDSFARFFQTRSDGQYAVAPPTPAWKAVAVVDLNYDGESDVIFQNGGYLGIWLMQAVELKIGTSLHGNLPINSKWRIVGPR